jgi:hypothetical protein
MTPRIYSSCTGKACSAGGGCGRVDETGVQSHAMGARTGCYGILGSIENLAGGRKNRSACHQRAGRFLSDSWKEGMSGTEMHLLAADSTVVLVIVWSGASMILLLHQLPGSAPSVKRQGSAGVPPKLTETEALT